MATQAEKAELRKKIAEAECTSINAKAPVAEALDAVKELSRHTVKGDSDDDQIDVVVKRLAETLKAQRAAVRAFKNLRDGITTDGSKTPE